MGYKLGAISWGEATYKQYQNTIKFLEMSTQYLRNKLNILLISIYGA